VTRVSSLRPVSGSADEILALLREWDAARSPDSLVIETSGSTGSPKRVVLSRSAMRASALATHERLGGPGQWVLNLPPTYVAGLQVLYRCVVAGTSPVAFGPSFAETRSRVTGRSYVSLVPTQLVRVLHRSRPELAALADFDAVLIGGGPLDPATRASAEEAGVRVVQTYGMSETCGGCVYDGLPLAGVEVRIDDGALLLRGPVLFDGYEGDPAKTESVLRDGWFHTADLGHVDSSGRLHVDGRTDDVIISGGVKVPAPAVAAAIGRMRGVVAVEVVGRPDPEWGERVVAVVAARDPISLAAVRDEVEPRSWAPRQLVVVDSLPSLPNGKVDRLRARELAARD
jgi:O-succinylbenzoic acid--CoA ligase